MYETRILESARRDLARLDRPIGLRIVKRIRWLADNLDQTKLTPLTGAEYGGLFKLRVGDHRVIYQVLREENTLVVHAIGHRREIYRQIR